MEWKYETLKSEEKAATAIRRRRSRWTRTLAGLGGGGDGERLGQRGEEHPRGGRRRQAGAEKHRRKQRERHGPLSPSHRCS